MRTIGDPGATSEAISAKKPDFVFFGGLYDQAGPFFKQIRKSGYTGTLLGGDGLDSPDLLKLGGPALLEGDGIFYTSILVNPRVYPQAASFIRDFQEKYQSYPQPFAAPAYDALGICLKAIETAARAKNGETPTRRDVAEAIRALRDYPGITNVFNFNERGDPRLSKYMVVKIAFPDPERWSENEVIQVLEIAPPTP
jgi:branched-chain amino acid transport system substrate-binding protein